VILQFYLFRLGQIGNVFSSSREDELDACKNVCSLVTSTYMLINILMTRFVSWW
jgi:hypothetical protein